MKNVKNEPVLFYTKFYYFVFCPLENDIMV